MRALDVSVWPAMGPNLCGLRPASCSLLWWDGVCVRGSHGHSKLQLLKALVHTDLLKPGLSPFSRAEQSAHRLPHVFLYYFF